MFVEQIEYVSGILCEILEVDPDFHLSIDESQIVPSSIWEVAPGEITSEIETASVVNELCAEIIEQRGIDPSQIVCLGKALEPSDQAFEIFEGKLSKKFLNEFILSDSVKEMRALTVLNHVQQAILCGHCFKQSFSSFQ